MSSRYKLHFFRPCVKCQLAWHEFSSHNASQLNVFERCISAVSKQCSASIILYHVVCSSLMFQSTEVDCRHPSCSSKFTDSWLFAVLMSVHASMSVNIFCYITQQRYARSQLLTFIGFHCTRVTVYCCWNEQALISLITICKKVFISDPSLAWTDCGKVGKMNS